MKLFCLILSLMLVSDNEVKKYDEAVKIHQKENKPLVVVLTADWCLSCRPFKKLMRNFLLNNKNYVYTEINVDKQPEIADKIKVSPTLPQTIIFTVEKNKFLKMPFIGGGNDISPIRDFLKNLKRE